MTELTVHTLELLKAGWYWEIIPMTFGKQRIILTDGGAVEEFYCMRNLTLAVQAHRDLVVDGVAPERGWIRKFVGGVFTYPCFPDERCQRYECEVCNPKEGR